MNPPKILIAGIKKKEGIMKGLLLYFCRHTINTK